jgi:orotidine-5'-phosphate decarboxylase
MKCDLILALDLDNRAEALDLLRELRGGLHWVKIGLQMFTAHGPAVVEEVAALGFRVFLDLKLHDIPHTVAKAVQSLASLPIGMLTLHTSGGTEMMRWAEQARQQHAPDLLLLGVTVLTSHDDETLRATGVSDGAAAQVDRLAHLAAGAGLRGLVCSPREVAALRAELPPALQFVTPGVRPAGSAADEQKRVMTPAEAAAAGANYIVVGRPILRAPDPAAAARAILDELAVAASP